MRSKAPSILLESADVVLDADPVVSPDLTICPMHCIQASDQAIAMAASSAMAEAKAM